MRASQPPHAPRPARAFRPARVDGLEVRSLPSGFAVPAEVRALSGAPQAPASPADQSTDPFWQDATAYQFGPSPDQTVWVKRPAVPNGRLDVIVHSGGFATGDPTGNDVLLFARRDIEQGTTVVSVGYRKVKDSAWPAPVDDIAKGIDVGVRLASALTGVARFDVTETGLSAGGTALALINYSPRYPGTVTRPDRIVTVSAPLMSNAMVPFRLGPGLEYAEVLRWGRTPPKSAVPITLMGTPDDPIARETGEASNVNGFAAFLRRYGVPVATYLDPHAAGQHGSTAWDALAYPDTAAAMAAAYRFGG